MAQEVRDAGNEHDIKYRFKPISDEKKKILMDGRNRENTQKATESAICQLQGFLTVRDLGKLDDITNDMLPNILLDFYTAVQPPKKDSYSIQTLKCMRAALNRFFHAERNLNIITDTRFVKTNEMFKGVLVEAKKTGHSVKKLTAKITEQDLFKIGQFFQHDHMNYPNPKLLQRNVIFYIIYFFCRCGRENLYTMTKDTFKVEVDPAEELEYIVQSIDELDKNHGINNTKPTNEGRMYADPGKNYSISMQNITFFIAEQLKVEHKTQNWKFLTGLEMCPVSAFKFYMSKLNPSVNFLWQKTKSGKLHYTDGVWYEPHIIGKDPLERFMTFLSKDAQLSLLYTNHSIRATCITTLDRNGVEARHIIKLSSHKNESTVKEYATECPTKKRKEMFQYLSDSINPQQKIKKQKSATISINPDNTNSDTTLMTQNLDQGTILDLPNMQLQEINNFDTIDDDLLANILYETEKENCDQNKQI